MKIGLALGGGAARGLAHLGVLRVLIEERVPIDLIVGTSIGAMVGGLYASTLDIDSSEKRFVDFLESPAFSSARFAFLKELKSGKPGVMGNIGRFVRRGIFLGYSVSRPSFISAQQFERNINSLLDDTTIESTRIPFAAVACDLRSGEAVVIQSGSIRRAVSASSAIPGVLPPVAWEDRLLVDGGWVSKVPILQAFKLGCDAVIAVDISTEMRDSQKLTRGYDIIFRASAITESILKRMQLRMADVLIRPDVGAINWADFGRSRECIRLGTVAARARVGEIAAMLESVSRGEFHGKKLAGYYMGDRLHKPPKE